MKSNSRVLAFASIAASVLLVLGTFLAIWLLSSGSPSNPASAQGQDQTAAKPSTITVRGSGTVQARPDMMTVNIGVSIQKDTVKAAQNEVSSAMSEIESKIKAAGIAEKDYRTTVYNVEPVMDYSGGEKGQQSRLIGFRVTNMYEITLRDTSRAAELLDSLTTAGANQIYGITFGLSNAEELARQAYDEAVKDAEERAQRLAGLSGLKLGKIVSISEASANVPGPVYSAKDGMGAGGAASFAPGQQTVQTDLIVVYEAEK